MRIAILEDTDFEIIPLMLGLVMIIRTFVINPLCDTAITCPRILPVKNKKGTLDILNLVLSPTRKPAMPVTLTGTFQNNSVAELKTIMRSK